MPGAVLHESNACHTSVQHVILPNLWPEEETALLCLMTADDYLMTADDCSGFS